MCGYPTRLLSSVPYMTVWLDRGPLHVWVKDKKVEHLLCFPFLILVLRVTMTNMFTKVSKPKYPRNAPQLHYSQIGDVYEDAKYSELSKK